MRPLDLPPATDVDRLLSKRGVSTLLGVSERTVDRLVAARRLPAYRIGGQRRFRVADVAALIAESEERP
ncbi:MAG: helix-turn-helix domain-containing protein [Solirubrobacteraceae bacterium]